MFRQSSYSREFAEMERRMKLLERRIEGFGTAASRTAASGFASAAQATDRVGDALVSALGDLVDRFRGSGRNLGDEVARFSQEAGKFGNVAIRRVSAEIEHRPLVMIGVAVGIGLLIGFAGRRN